MSHFSVILQDKNSIDKDDITPFLLWNFFFFFFLEPLLQHMKVPRLGVTLELQLQAYATVIATPDPNPICDLRCSLLNPLSWARDQTCIFMDMILGS